MKQLHQMIAAVVVALGALAQTVQAELITGYISFTGLITLNTASPATATAVTSWINAQVNDPQGAFASGPYAVANDTPVTITSQIWDFNTTAPITNFWSVGGFKFELQSSYVLVQGGTPGFTGYVSVDGVGIVSGNGFTPTAFSYSFSVTDPPANGISSWAFAASIASMNSNGAPVLVTTRLPNATILSWSDSTFALQSAPSVNGTFTNIPDATSPYTNAITGTQQYFRLLQP